jgi:hypothetical protein
VDLLNAVQGKDLFGDIAIDGCIILKQILEK